uniref:ABC transporter domain-containing protein n=1 Tax=Trieres chinensis TaxID=1514140 RepID=A0A7S2EEV5_TRICV
MNASDRFVNMFDRLDSLVESKKIVTYGVSVTTLDEVFLMVARGDTGHEEVQDSVRKSTMNQNENGLVEEVPDNVSITSKSYKSLADMNETTVFNRHVQALFAKRAMNFKRDKKAWCCSTVCPSVFALIGFLMITFIPVARNMDPLTLTLDDNNPGVKPDERNPIPFNKAGGKYSCQPGSCISWPPSFDSNGTNEKYSYCGWEARINADGSTCSGFSCSAAECSISESGEIVDKITNYGTFLVEEDVSDVKESSEALYNSSSLFAASQYGALYFTHDPTSTIDEMGSTYNNKTVASCEKNSGNYTNPDQCASFSGVGYIVQTNHTAPHASLLYQSVGDEALIRAAKGDTMGRYKIIPTIHPLPITSVEDSYLKAEQAFTPWFLMVLSLPFITGAFATFIVAERQSKAKHLQTVAGVKPAAYWFSSYLWDIMNYQLPLWIIVILMFAFDVELFTTTERGVLGGTIMSLFLFGPAAAGFTYCFSFLFKSPSLCNLSVIVFNFLIGMAGPLVTFILRLIGTDPTLENAQKFVNIAIAVEWVLRFFPMFNMSKALFYIINIQILVGLTGNSDLSVWSSDVCLIEVLYLAAQSILYILLAIQIDKWSTKPKAVQMWRQFVDVITCGYLRRHASRLFGKGSRHNEREVVLADSPDDEDVAAEKQRVLDGEADSDPIVLKELSKQYANGKLAVNGLSFGIPSGTCFGLLGINGAGKTTTMAMLTAEFPPSKGDAVLAGYSVKNEPEQTRKRIGYCPQFDAHFMNMTGKEHVELYASIKGVPKEVIKDAVSAKLAEVGLSEFDSQRLSAGYSGGMKRKLSVACATIGQPQIVFLDEPSTGMDPVARRDLWKVISRMVVGGPDEDPLDKTSLILTTHSMEECEALCPLIGIMAGGRLRCLGSAQRLKSRFGEGFQVETKCKGVTPEDSDYQSILSQLQQELGKSPDGDEEITSIFIKLDQVLEAVKALTGDEFLSSMITEDDPIGYVIHKEASSDVGINLNELAAFCVEELRVKAVIDFFGGTYPGSVLRERQDNKVRYEVGSVGLKISSLFSTIEENKSKLQLSDYGVSQTSLEQVFNMFAAEAEERKQNTVD